MLLRFSNILVFLLSIIFTSCKWKSSNSIVTNDLFEPKNISVDSIFKEEGSYYSTVKLDDIDFNGQLVKYRINDMIVEHNDMSKVQLDELFKKCTVLTKQLFQNPKEINFINLYHKSFIPGFEPESIKENTKQFSLLIIVQGTPIKTPNFPIRVEDNSTWAIEFHIDGNKISNPKFIDLHEDESGS